MVREGTSKGGKEVEGKKKAAAAGDNMGLCPSMHHTCRYIKYPTALYVCGRGGEGVGGRGEERKSRYKKTIGENQSPVHVSSIIPPLSYHAR